jgi:phosphopantothenoylcysteine decarboxylase/phosphopantothenate--cysteine ligase
VVLGVTGGIAAYKAVELARLLKLEGAVVVPVLSSSSLRFVGRATFAAVTGQVPRVSLWDAADPIPHTELGQRAELVIVAPATAHLLARYAHGIADDLLTATLLAARAPVLVAPAMHQEMWAHPAVQENIDLIASRGVAVVGPEYGELAGGDVGMGRMADPEKILRAGEELVAKAGQLAGLKVVVSAGGTKEPLDAVRFVGNRSSGRQGHAIAAEAARRGAQVVLVSAASGGFPAGVEVVRVETAEEMARAMDDHVADADVVVMAAAVSDFRPAEVAVGKLDRRTGPLQVTLEPVPDILASLVAKRPRGQLLVGFAAEVPEVGTEGTSQWLAERAMAKLKEKGVDLVVANDVSVRGRGFESEWNAAVIVDADGVMAEVPLSPKSTVAAALLDAVAEKLARL